MREAEELVVFLRKLRVSLHDEKRMQSDMAEAFESHDVEFEREVTLSPGDIVDFLVGSVAIECKLKGQGKRSIFRQLERYARHECVQAIILVTNVSMGLPKEVGGKSLYYVSAGGAWL